MKSKHRISALFITLIILCFCQSVGAFNNYKFRTLSPDGGFYYDGVKAIVQDKEGFIWIMMDNDLYRFDGFQYKKYYPYFTTLDFTGKWLFHNMISDTSGNLYVNTSNGLFRYDAFSDSFEKIYKEVSVLSADQMDNLWFWNNGIWSIYNKETEALHTPAFDRSPATYTSPVMCTHNNDLYTFVNQKVYRYNHVNNEFVRCFTLPVEGKNVRFAKATQGKLWVFVNGEGLYKVDLSTLTVEEHFDFLANQSSGVLRDFHIDKKGYIWYGTINGLYVLDPSTRKYAHYAYNERDPFSLPSNSIWTINEDKQRNVWIGMYSGKICYVNIDEGNAFSSFFPATSKLSHAPVSAFAEDDNWIWIGTEGGGINRINRNTNEFSHLTIANDITSNNIKSIVTDAGQNLWISTFMGGLDFYDTKKKKRTNYKRVRGNPNSLLIDDVRKVVLEGTSGLWIAYQYWKPEISYFSFADRTFTHFSLDSIKENTYIFDILRQGEKYLWAISNEQLYRMDITTQTVEKMAPNDSTYMGLYTCCPDDSGNIWIGTIGNGLLKFDPNTSEYTFFKDLQHQDIYSIYSICYDDGNIWMGTDNGLYCYNIARNDLSTFDKIDGTQGQVYYPLATLKGKDGKLYFGGTNGFTIVDPKKIARNEYKPKVIISDFFIDHKPSHPNSFMGDSIYEIVLSHNQTNFGLQFSSDNYHIPEKSLFKYRLKGYDDRWIEADASNRTAMYAKVPPGTYYFEVLAANNDGIWSETPTVLKIKRKPAPWLSWPAYLIYILIVVAVAYQIYRYYKEKKKLKMQLYLENVEKDKKEQIHQAQLRFFTNISHDFRTPLSLIIAALDKLRREGLKEYYFRILNGNAQRLLNLVNELMDFRTVENSKMKLALQPLNINEFVKDIASSFVDYAAQRHIMFNVKCDKDLPENLYADKNVLEKVVMNLLNNAFKYTPENGTISIETKAKDQLFVSEYKGQHTVGDTLHISDSYAIIVRDTGVGISKESISSVFERFYKVNTVNVDSHLGTGIGLALVKSLILLHKGCISIYSERYKGTDMVVRFPYDSSGFEEADFLKEEHRLTKEATDPDEMSVSPDIDTQKKDNLFVQTTRKILIAEDNADLRNLIAESLSDEFNVTQAADGIEASELIEKIDFDLIISDIMMPLKDGIALCSEVKENINTSHIPFVLLTAKTGLESKIEGVDSNADLYLEKPIDLDYLKLSILNIFKNRQQLKEHYAKNYYADSSELSSNEQDNKFLKKLTGFIEAHLDQSEMDVNLIASEFSMSRSKLYTKVKNLTGKSVVEFVLNYRLRKAAKLIIEEDLTMKEVMMQIGIESQPYFTNSFKKMFGETPTAFAAKHKKKKED